MLSCVLAVILEKGDAAKIGDYIRDLSKADYVSIGTDIGLDGGKLQDLPADRILITMINWWLEMRDYVSNTPTWKTLIAALKKRGLNGHVKRIENDLKGKS